MQHLMVKLGMSTAFHPQTDGQTERVNAVVEQLLRNLVNQPMTNWEKQLPLVSFAINNSKAESTGQTPFFLNFGKHPRAPADAHRLQIEDKVPAVGQVLTEMYDTLDSVKVLLKRAQDSQKSYADKKEDHIPLQKDSGSYCLSKLSDSLQVKGNFKADIWAPFSSQK